MKRTISITLVAFVVLTSLVSVAAQETAGALPVRSALNDSTGTAKSAEPVLTEIYRVGVGDVLDIRLINSPTNRSTLFTVMPGGAIDLPLAGGAIGVVGLTTDEIQARIAAELKRRAVEDKAQVSVGVRQYVSHAVMVNGLVVQPGTRYLRREAVPLYVVLAESQLRNDAGRVMIMRAGTEGETLELSDPQTLNITIQPGDVITVSHKPQEFYYIGGRVNYPGQKTFQTGITLLQAILAAGGTTRLENRVEISRAGTDGRLTTIRYRLKEIKAGNVEDPKLLPGDRIEISK
jgi:protein involved in polysaccharide export with SLBB domain